MIDLNKGKLRQKWEANCLTCDARHQTGAQWRQHAEKELQTLGWILRTDSAWLCPKCRRGPNKDSR